MALYHAFTNGVADGTNTQVVRPSDWNSGHIQAMTISGNTVGFSSFSGTNIVFQGGNNVTLSADTAANAATVIVSGPNIPAQTVDTNKAGTGFTTVATAGAVMAGTHDTNGLNLAVPAFLTTAQPVGAYLTTAALSNHSHNLATTTTNGSQIVVATTNSAGATLAVPAFLTTAQAPGAYLTTARASNDAIGLNTAITQNGVSMTANSSGLSLNFPAFLTTAAQSNHSHSITVNGTNINYTTGGNSNGVQLSLSVPAQSTQTQPAGNIAGVGTTFNGTNVSGSMTLNSNGLRLDLSGQGGGVINQTGPNIGAGTQTATSGTVVFANSNNITFGMSGETQVTASFNPINIGMSTNGNTAGTTGTFDGAGLQYILAGGNNVTLSQSANGSSVTLSIHAGGGGAAGTLSTYFMDFQGASTSQTHGAMGASTNSAYFVPIWVSENIAFNCIRWPAYLSHATSSVSGQQSITSHFGIFSNNAGTLSQISTSSFSMAITNSSVSATLSYPNATNTTGYAYGTTTATTTAQIQSLWGTGGTRLVDWQFGNSMSLTPGIYWLGFHVRQSSSSANVGISYAMAGNIFNMFNHVAPIGVISSAQTTNSAYRAPLHGMGVYTLTSTGLPSNAPLTQINQSLSVMPVWRAIST